MKYFKIVEVIENKKDITGIIRAHISGVVNEFILSRTLN